MTTTTTALNNEFRDFAMAALQIGGSLLETLTPEQHHALDGALQAGARLSLEFGPIPAFETLSLVLIEREGARHQIASAAVNKGPVQ
jgi:hypothetical protein